jgi:hypothetical protein
MLRTVSLHLGTVASACILLGCKMEEESQQIQDVVSLSHVLGFPLQESVRRVDAEEEEEDDDSMMTNDEPKLGAVGDDGRHGQLVATIVKL